MHQPRKNEKDFVYLNFRVIVPWANITPEMGEPDNLVSIFDRGGKTNVVSQNCANKIRRDALLIWGTGKGARGGDDWQLLCIEINQENRFFWPSTFSTSCGPLSPLLAGQSGLSGRKTNNYGTLLQQVSDFCLRFLFSPVTDISGLHFNCNIRWVWKLLRRKSGKKTLPAYHNSSKNKIYNLGCMRCSRSSHVKKAMSQYLLSL